MIDLYREQILDHYKNPRNFGNLENPDYEASLDNPLCGDRITIYLNIRDNKVISVKFDGEGCAISQASASMLTDHIIGKSLSDLEKLQKEDIFEMLGVDISLARLKCALLPLDALRSALNDKT